MKISCVRFAFATLLSACGVGANVPDQKQCVFALEIVKEGGGMQVEKNDSMMGTGIFIYEHSGGWLTAERHYRFHEFAGNHDPKVDPFGSGVDFTAKMRTLLREAHLRNFSFANAVADAKDKAALKNLA